VPRERENIRGCTELGSIKDRFEKGDTMEIDIKRTIDDYMDIKAAGSQARARFTQSGEPVVESKNKLPPQQISRKSMMGSEELDDAQEVTNLVNRFKMIETGELDALGEKKQRERRQITPPPAGYRAELESQQKARDSHVASGGFDESYMPAADTKNLKARFEQISGAPEGAMSEETRKRLEDEFAIFKALKERQQQEVQDSKHDNLATLHDEELQQIAKAHASKMAAKWEKIHAKEAKKAQKAIAKSKANAVRE